jgi:hypothetical protein
MLEREAGKDEAVDCVEEGGVDCVEEGGVDCVEVEAMGGGAWKDVTSSKGSTTSLRVADVGRDGLCECGGDMDTGDNSSS